MRRLEELTDDELREVDAHLLALAPILPHSAYQTDPVGWAADKLGIPEHTLRWSLNGGYATHRWDGNTDPLASMAEGLRDWKDVAVESGTGTGKSYAAAIIILWFLACWENAQVFTFALTADQLKLFIWRNITELWPRFKAHFPTAEITNLAIRMRGGIDETWAANGRPVQIRAGETVASRAQGMHEEHMLLVYEEAAAMEWAIIEAGRNTCTRPHNLRLFIGNPNHQLDSLHRVSQTPGVISLRASALDHPNVVSPNPDTVPGTISREKLALRKQEYGETSPVYLSRVRGISPEQATDALIRVEWLRAAQARWEAKRDAGTLPTRSTGKGVDVANSEHGDRACIVDFGENVCIRVDAFQCPDANLLGGKVVQEARRDQLDPQRVAVDAIGVGAGTVNEARRQAFIVAALYAGGKPMTMIEKAPDGQTVEWSPDVNLFENLRGQMYWQAREDLRNNEIDVPFHKELWQELVAHTFESEGKVVKLLPKDEVKILIGRSPDHSDAFVMANWVRVRAVVPVKPEREQGRTAGFDYNRMRPADKVLPEQDIAAILQGGQNTGPQFGRYAIPSNRQGR